MGKFNKTKQPVQPTEINDMGERAYKLSAKEELVSTCLTTFLQASYYEGENEIMTRIVTAIKNADDPLFVAKLAIYLRHTANMRSSSHLLAGELAPMISGEKWARSFYKRVYNRPDDMSEILAYVFSKQKKRKIPSAMKRAFSDILASMDAYTMDKYKMKNRAIKLIDLINLVRPKPSQKNEEAFHRLMKGESLDGLYVNKTVEKTMSKAGQEAKETQATEEEADELKGAALLAMLSQQGGMPIMSLLRNLRNLLLYTTDSATINLAAIQLTDPKRILNSRQLPFRFANAYNAIDEMTAKDEPKSVVFEKDGQPFAERKKVLLNAVERAMEISCMNIPKLEGNTAILADHSGSVRGDSGGSSRLSAFGKTTTAMVGNLMATQYAYAQDNVYIGLFGDRLINIPVDRKMGMIEFNNFSFSEGSKCGGNTENGIYVFLDKCIREKIRVDNLIIFSDMVIGDGGTGGWDRTSNSYKSLGYKSFQDLFRKFKTINPKCNTISVNIKDTKGTSVFDKSLNVTQVSGWSTSIFNVFANACRGYDSLIKEIEAIEI